MMKIWNNLTSREQISLMVLALFMGLFLAYVLLVMPLFEKREQSLIALNDEKARYQRIMQMAKSTQGTSEKNSINDLSSPPIREAATAASRQSGVAISRIQPEADNKVTFWIDKAGTQAIMNWLVLLKTQYGYNPSKVTIQKNTGEESLRGQFEFEGDIS